MSPKVLRSLVFLSLLLAPAAALAAPEATLEQVVAAVEVPFRPGAARPLRDVSARFEQTALIAAIEQEQQARGRLWLQFDPRLPAEGLPARFRWVYEAPGEQLIVADGEQIWVWLPDNNQVLRSAATRAVASGSENPVTLLTGLGNLRRDFSIAWDGDGGSAATGYRLLLKPRNAGAYVSQVRLEVTAAAVGAGEPVFPLRSLTVEDGSGNRTQVRFSEVAVNRGVDPALFRFTPPAGAEVLRPEDLQLR